MGEPTKLERVRNIRTVVIIPIVCPTSLKKTPTDDNSHAIPIVTITNGMSTNGRKIAVQLRTSMQVKLSLLLFYSLG